MTLTTLRRQLASRVTVHRAVSPSHWNAYVASRPDATGYHCWEWSDVITRAFGHETRYLAAESASGIIGVLPLVVLRSRLFGRSVVSMPFLNYGGVLADTPEARAVLLDAAIAEAKEVGAAYLELRHRDQVFPALRSKRHKVAMVLPLQSTADAQWTALDRKVRNQIRKAEKNDLQVQIGGAELLSGFYRVFARNMRDLGTPVYGVEFFAEILKAFERQTRIVCIALRGEPIAASLVYCHRNVCEVPWASSVRTYNALCPNVLLYWSMLKLAIDRGAREFDFGRSTPNEGTFHFKQQWGAQPRELVWEYWTATGDELPDLSPKNARYGHAIAVWQRLPVGVTTLIGPRIVRSIP